MVRLQKLLVMCGDFDWAELPADHAPWKLPPSLTDLNLHVSARSPRLIASGLRTLWAPLSEPQFYEVLASNRALSSLAARWPHGNVVDVVDCTQETAAALLSRTSLACLHALGFCLPPACFSQLLSRMSALTELRVRLPDETPPSQIISALRALPALTRLRVDGDFVAAADRKEVKADGAAGGAPCELATLTDLSLGLGDDALTQFRMPRLEYLRVAGGGVSPAAVQHLMQQSTELTELEFVACGSVTDDLVVEALARCGKLEQLRLDRCAQISVVTFISLSFSAPQTLKRLSIMDCPLVTDALLSLSVAEPVVRALTSLVLLCLPLADDVKSALTAPVVDELGGGMRRRVLVFDERAFQDYPEWE